ncbi:hypothetical protein K0A97_00790 [Patescibacteria group bacterium]|nr:hypothetical protein [Patescibacteria group bacterium]
MSLDKKIDKKVTGENNRENSDLWSEWRFSVNKIKEYVANQIRSCFGRSVDTEFSNQNKKTRDSEDYILNENYLNEESLNNKYRGYNKSIRGKK